MKYTDITNMRFGKLIALKIANNNTKYSSKWICKCDCGNQCIKQRKLLIRGATKSCGCLRVERGKSMFKGVGKLSKSHWLSVLRHAKDRNIKIDITIQDAWNQYIKQDGKCNITGILIFFGNSREEENKGKTTASLDRIDSSKDYTIDNIQWVHKKVNQMKWNLTQEDFICIANIIALKHPRNNPVTSLSKSSESQ